MTVTVKTKHDLVVPPSMQLQAGIKAGDRVRFKVSAGTITITAAPARSRSYKPSKAELAAIRKGEAAFACGDSVSLTEFLNELDRQGRKAGTKGSR